MGQVGSCQHIPMSGLMVGFDPASTRLVRKCFLEEGAREDLEG